MDGTGADVLSLAVASGDRLTVGYILTALPLDQDAHSTTPLAVAVMFGHKHLLKILLDMFKPNDPLPYTGIVLYHYCISWPIIRTVIFSLEILEKKMMNVF